MDWATLAAQVPLVAAFVWFSLEQQKRSQASMDKRDEAYIAVLAAISKKLEDHDTLTREAIATMKERTQPIDHSYQRRKTDRSE